MVGLDLSKGAISFCHAIHRFPNSVFILGDAESIPFHDASLDVIINLESSHHYPDVRAFYKEVYRTLAVGGHFLYATLLPAERIHADVEQLRNMGFALERDQDVTANVMASCEKTGQEYAILGLGGEDVDAVAADALALPGTPTYETMKSGRCAYRILELRKARGQMLS